MTICKPPEAVSGKSRTESYLLNLYHAGDRESVVVGTVEKLGNEDKHAFHSIQELLHLLGIEQVESEEQDNEQTI